MGTLECIELDKKRIKNGGEVENGFMLKSVENFMIYKQLLCIFSGIDHTFKNFLKYGFIKEKYLIFSFFLFFKKTALRFLKS